MPESSQEKKSKNTKASIKNTEALAFLVAGVGLEPTPSGYEPDELPLLHPAMSILFTITTGVGQFT